MSKKPTAGTHFQTHLGTIHSSPRRFPHRTTILRPAVQSLQSVHLPLGSFRSLRWPVRHVSQNTSRTGNQRDCNTSYSYRTIAHNPLPLFGLPAEAGTGGGGGGGGMKSGSGSRMLSAAISGTGAGGGGGGGGGGGYIHTVRNKTRLEIRRETTHRRRGCSLWFRFRFGLGFMLRWRRWTAHCGWWRWWRSRRGRLWTRVQVSPE